MILAGMRSDAELVRRTLAEEPWASEALVLRYQKKACAIAGAAGVPPDSIDDVVQESFYKGFLRLSELRNPASFGPWFLTIVRNAARSHLRAAGRSRWNGPQGLESVEGRAPDPLEAKEFQEHLWRAVGELPDTIREAIFLYYHEGESLRAVARTLDITTSAAKDRLRKGREILRDRLWRELREALLDMLPSAREWRRKARKMTLLVLASLAPAWARALDSAAATSSSVPATAAKIVLAGGIMSGKKIAVSISIAVLLILGGIGLHEIGSGRGSGGAGPRTAVPPQPPVAEGVHVAVSKNGADMNSGSRATKFEAPARSGAVGASIAGKVLSAGRGLEDARILALDTAAWQAAIDGVENEASVRWDPAVKQERLRNDLLRLAKKIPATSSGADGSFRFQDLPDGIYRLLASSDGFLPSSSTLVGVVRGVTARAEIGLEPALAISGRVVDVSGAPVPGTKVGAESRGSTAIHGIERRQRRIAEWQEGKILLEPTPAESGPDGRFWIGGLEPTAYEVTARKEGFLDGKSPPVAAGSRDVVLTLEAGLSVHGRVVGPDGRPVAGAEAKVSPLRNTEVHRVFSPYLFDDDSCRRILRVSTSDDGRFLIPGLEAGSFVLTASAEGFPPIEKEFVLALDPLDLGDLTLHAPRAISGKVRDPAGNPFPGVRVWARKAPRTVRGKQRLAPQENQALSEARSGPGGAFTLEGLPAGAFEIRASAEGFADAFAKDVRAGAGGLELVLQSGLTVHGKAIDGETSAPVGGAEVRVGSWGELWATTDDQGVFLIRGLSPSALHFGMTGIWVTHPEYDRYEDLNAGVVGRDEGSPLVIPLSRGEKITGRVSDGDGNPVAGASVWIESTVSLVVPLGSRDLEIRTSSGKDGLFALRAPRVLRGQFNQPGFLVIASQPGKGRGRAGPFPVPASGEPWPDLEILLSRATIEGKVTDGEGKGIACAKISVLPGLSPREDRWPSPGSGISAFSGPDGGYRIAGIERGDAMVVAEAIAYAPRKIPGVTIGEDVVHLDMVLERGEAVAGQVLDSLKGPVAGAEVVAVPEDKEIEEESGLFDSSEYAQRMQVLEASGIAAARAGPDGAFRLADLPDGWYRIIARAPGYEAGVTPSVRPGTSGMEIVLQRFSAISGAVLAADTREPVKRFTVDLVDPKKLRDQRAKSKIMFLDYRVASEGEIVFEHPGGRFLYDGLRPGEYVVLVQADGFTNATREVSLKAGVEETVEIPLDRGGKVEGIVLDKETGAPVVGASISFWSGKEFGTPGGGEDGEELRTMPPEIITGRDGRFSVLGLRDGNYTIGINHPYYCSPPHKSVTFEIPRGDEGPIEIRLAPAGRMEGRLRGHTGWEKGKRHTRYNLTLKRVREDPENPGKRKPDPWGNPLWVDSEGRYRADSLEPGTYLIELTKQAVEIGEEVSLGPSGGLVGYKEKGPEEKILSQEIEVRARETNIFNAVILPEPSDPGGE